MLVKFGNHPLEEVLLLRIRKLVGQSHRLGNECSLFCLDRAWHPPSGARVSLCEPRARLPRLSPHGIKPVSNTKRPLLGENSSKHLTSCYPPGTGFPQI